ncbi:MAG: DUF1553 domain-containing protein, partial [Planctomycetia bacterium]|nr:DUF1553 domain-containing protein [Planctomycetia bacterium]
SLFAFFNNVPEKGRAIKIGNSPPYVQSPTRLQAKELCRLEEQAGDAHKAISDHRAEIENARLRWEHESAARKIDDWYPIENLEAHLSFEGDAKELAGDGRAESRQGNCDFVAGRVGQAAAFKGAEWLELPKAGNFGFFDKFTLAAWVRVDDNGGGTILSRMADVAEGEGYQLALISGKLQLNLVKRWLDDALRVETSDSLSTGEWHHVATTYDGSRVADGVKLYINGRPQKLNVLLDELNQSFTTKEPLRIGGGGGPKARFRGLIDEVRIYKSSFSPDEVAILATPQSIVDIVVRNPANRTEIQKRKLEACFIEQYAPPPVSQAYRSLKAAEQALAEFREKLPTVMVMEEMPGPRPTHLLIRGQYDKPGEKVEANVPATLPPLPTDAPRNRLGLARWIVDRANPLTGRVFVNRLWQLHIGIGLVKTSEDFGLQGEWPSHPELLDWLACEFASDWDMKRLQRTIVTSATFRQSSAASNSTDTENRLLSRGPRLRLSAEMIRDQALFASGTLVEQLGGPSVKPLQPAGLWSELTGGNDYQPGTGAELVRRSLYTFWKRTIPPPTLAAFDSPSREACVVRESRTNTPLQALTLLNEPTFVAAAKALAQRVMREATSPEERIERAMLYIIGRRPTGEETTILSTALDRYQNRGMDDSRAYAMVCSTILNLDEAVTNQ